MRRLSLFLSFFLSFFLSLLTLSARASCLSDNFPGRNVSRIRAYAWHPLDEDSVETRYLDIALNWLTQGKSYEASLVEDSRLAEDVFRSFSKASSHWDEIVPQFVGRVSELSHGQATLEPLEASEVSTQVKGLARYFELRLKTSQGEIRKLVALGQAGFTDLPGQRLPQPREVPASVYPPSWNTMKNPDMLLGQGRLVEEAGRRTLKTSTPKGSSSVGLASHGWHGIEEPRQARYLDEALEALAKGESLNAANYPNERLSEDFMSAFVRALWNPDKVVHQFIERVTQASHGNVTLIPIDASESSVRAKGLGEYFRLRQKTPDGETEKTVVLAQNGFNDLTEARPLAKSVRAEAQVPPGVKSTQALSADKLGAAWQKAEWRNGLHPFRYYNFKAVDRVLADSDLAAAAEKWMEINKTGRDPKFLDLSYQYLVYLGDARVKYRMPPGGNPGPRPMLDYLNTLMDAHKRGVDISEDVRLIEKFLEEYVHPDAGINLKKAQEALEYFNTWLLPRLHQHKIAEAFH